MQIGRIEIKNIRCFEHLTINFADNNSPTPWTLILGDNGVGKTTLLRSVALGLSSPKLAAALFEDTGSKWLREKASEGSIRVDFNSGESSELTIKQANWGESIVDHKGLPNSFHWEKLFVCGYGAARRIFGDRSFDKYSARDSVSSLFNYDAPLQNPELILRRLDSSTINQKEILNWIDCVLMLPLGSTRLKMSGLEIRGPWGEYTPVRSLGDGYQATLGWILDMLGWAMYHDYQKLESGIEGIVLIDEIEQHLHPQWQRRILSLLHKQFPSIQFISTTHSPLCVIGTTDFNDNEVNLILLRQEGECIEALSELKPPRGQRADQVLTSYLFGLGTTSDDETKNQIERLASLLSIAKPSESDLAEIASLRNVLGIKLGSEETQLERHVARAVQEVLANSLEESHLSSEAIGLEVKRQLRELLEVHD